MCQLDHLKSVEANLSGLKCIPTKNCQPGNIGWILFFFNYGGLLPGTSPIWEHESSVCWGMWPLDFSSGCWLEPLLATASSPFAAGIGISSRGQLALTCGSCSPTHGPWYPGLPPRHPPPCLWGGTHPRVTHGVVAISSLFSVIFSELCFYLHFYPA